MLKSRVPERHLADEIEAKMQGLRKRYLIKLSEQVEIIKQALDECQGGKLSSKMREQVWSCAHKLAGTGATYGFSEISVTGRCLDSFLKTNPDAPDEAVSLFATDLYNACLEAILGHEAKTDNHGATSDFNPSFSDAACPFLLVVDDDESVQSLFIELFDQEAQILTASDTHQALKLLYRHRPKLVLLDDAMPNYISGLKMLESISSTNEFPDTQFIMITANDSEIDRSRGLKAGAIDYITKPFELQKVTDKIREAFYA